MTEKFDAMTMEPAVREGRTVTITSSAIGRFLVLAVLLLTTANLLVDYLRLQHDRDWLFGFAPLFRVGSEASIPTFYSSSVLLLSGVLLLLVGVVRTRQRERYGTYWTLMGLALVYLAVDEGASIHERLWGLSQIGLSEEVRQSVLGRLPVIMVVIVASCLFLRFFGSLPPLYRRLFAVSIFLLFLGAIGMEVIGEDLVRPRHGQENWYYALSQSLEEFLEMSGAALFCFSTVLYIEKELLGLQLRLGSADDHSK